MNLQTVHAGTSNDVVYPALLPAAETGVCN
jgi:hypothetical protein